MVEVDDVEVEVLDVVEVVLLDELVVTSAAVVGAEVLVLPVLLSSLHEPTTRVRATTAKATVRGELIEPVCRVAAHDGTLHDGNGSDGNGLDGNGSDGGSRLLVGRSLYLGDVHVISISIRWRIRNRSDVKPGEREGWRRGGGEEVVAKRWWREGAEGEA